MFTEKREIKQADSAIAATWIFCLKRLNERKLFTQDLVFY